MSDTIQLGLPENAPAFLSRLRAGRFTSPNGVESVFLFDELTRSRGKKASSHSIADSDITILQDLGSGMQVFTLSVYFVGDNCDIEADAFYASLFERYTPDAPGILNHPRWGDVKVLPFGDPSQSEALTSESGVSRVSVEFRETASLSVVQSSVLSAKEVAAESTKSKSAALEKAKAIARSGVKAYSKFRAVVQDKTSMLKSTFDNMTGLTDTIRTEIDLIYNEIQESLAQIDEARSVLAQANAMIETVTDSPQKYTEMFNSMKSAASSVISSFIDDLFGSATPDAAKDVGYTYQSIATACVAGCAEIAIGIEYTTREQVGTAIDSLLEIYAEYSAGTATMTARSNGDITKTFIPDSNVDISAHAVVLDTIAILLSRAFSLKSRRLYTLTASSDPATETWTHYGTMDYLDFFCQTNKVGDNEFIELPAGRTIAVYE